MNPDEIRDLREKVPGWRAQADTLRQRAAQLEAEADAIDRIVDGVMSLPQPNPAQDQALFKLEPAISKSTLLMASHHASGDEEGPRGMAAAFQVMSEQPDRIWTAQEVHAVLEERGWVDPMAKSGYRATDVAIYRLRKRGSVRQAGRGKFQVVTGEGGDT